VIQSIEKIKNTIYFKSCIFKTVHLKEKKNTLAKETKSVYYCYVK